MPAPRVTVHLALGVRTTLALAALLATATLTVPATPVQAGGGCVSNAEYRHATRGMKRAAVNRLFGTRGEYYGRDRTGYAYNYDPCDPDLYNVAVGYRHNTNRLFVKVKF